jgi:hypothetical protein
LISVLRVYHELQKRYVHGIGTYEPYAAVSFNPAATKASPVVFMRGAPAKMTKLVPSATVLTACGPSICRSSRMEGGRATIPPRMKGMWARREAAEGGLGLGEDTKVMRLACAGTNMPYANMPMACGEHLLENQK